MIFIMAMAVVSMRLAADWGAMERVEANQARLVSATITNQATALRKITIASNKNVRVPKTWSVQIMQASFQVMQAGFQIMQARAFSTIPVSTCPFNAISAQCSMPKPQRQTPVPTRLVGSWVKARH